MPICHKLLQRNPIDPISGLSHVASTNLKIKVYSKEIEDAGGAMKSLLTVTVICAFIAFTAGAAVDGPLFETYLHYPVGIEPTSVCIADFDGDGTGDMAVVADNDYDYQVSILIGEGKGDFRPAVNYGLPDDAERVVAGFVDGDSYPDLVVGSGSGVFVLINAGDGTFGAASTVSGLAARPEQVFLADVNGDGDADLVVGHYEWDVTHTTVCLNDGSGNFISPATYTTAIYQAGLYCGDFTGDNRPEIVVTSWDAGMVYVLVNDGSGVFSTIDTYTPSAGPPIYVNGANVDGDSDLDLIVLTTAGATVFTNVAGSFTEGATYAVHGYEYDIAVADIDGVNGPDLVVCDDSVQVLFNDGSGAFNTSEYNFVGYTPLYLAVGNLDDDPAVDVAVTVEHWDSETPGTVAVLLNDGTGDFPHTYDVATGGAQGLVTCDFDGDGNLDLATADYVNDQVHILTNDGTGQYVLTNTYSAGDAPWGMVLGDVDGVNGPDLILSHWTPSILTVLKSNGDGTFQAATSHTVGNRPLGVFAADLDNDNDVDVVSVDRDDYTISILENLNNGGFAARTTQAIASYCYNGGIDGEDLDDDGFIDLVIADYSGNQVEILWNGGSLDFSTAGSVTGCYEAYSVCVEDLDSDGSPDIVVGSYDSSVVSFIRNTDPGFAAPVYFYSGWEHSQIRATDFDDDGLKDVAVLSESNSMVAVFLGEGSFNFGDPTGYGLQGTDAQGLCVGDFDKDGYDDIAIADYDDDQVSILFNRYTILTPVTEIVYGEPLPEKFMLAQNYPNPFNPTTTLAYSLPVRAEVKVSIYNLLGQRVRQFDEGIKPAGNYELVWDGKTDHGKTVATGLYLYRIEAGEFSEAKKMLLIK